MQNDSGIDIVRPKLTEYQKEILYCEQPNTITEASTKVGKTFSHLWWLFERAHQIHKPGANFWWVAPVYGQADIAFKRLKRVVIKSDEYEINNSHLVITTPNDTFIHFKSGEKPDNLYGEDVYAAVIDEMSRMREEAWFAIRSTLTHTKGPVKMIGNVNGTNNWSYRLSRDVEAQKIPGWKHFKITSTHAIQHGILDDEDIAAAKAVLPEGIFNELYYGIPFVNSSNKFCFAFNEKKHINSCSYDPRHPLYLSFDFNKNPICCVVIQDYDPGIGKKKIFVPDVIKLPNSNIYKLCEFIRNRYEVPGHKPLYLVCGDASGNAGSAMVKGLAGEEKTNYFTIIKTELEIGQSQMQQLPSNPKIEDNQVLVNAMFEHYPMSIDPEYAAALIFDCKFVEMRPDGTIKKADRDDPAQQADALDGFRYFLNRYHRDFIKTKR